MQRLTVEECDALIDEVRAAFPSADDFRDALPRELRSWAADNLPQNQDRAGLVTSVCRHANDNGLVGVLLTELHRRTAHRGLLAVIGGISWLAAEQRRRIREATTSLLVLDQPMFNREYLRRRLQKFLDPGTGTRRLLVVPSSAWPGKSYTTYMIIHLSDALGLRYVLIDCERIKTSIDACRIIANALGLHDADVVQQLRDTSRPGETFSSWLEGKVEQSSTRRTWIVFDHVAKPKSSDEVEKMAKSLADGAVLGKFRSLYITLIDSDYSPPYEGFGSNTPLFRDNPLTPLNTADFQKFLLDLSKGAGRPLTSEEAHAEALKFEQELEEDAENGIQKSMQKQSGEKARLEMVRQRLHACMRRLGYVEEEEEAE